MACIAVCSAAPALGVTHWSFALDSLPLNVYLTYLAYKFYRDADRDFNQSCSGIRTCGASVQVDGLFMHASILSIALRVKA